MPLQSRHYWVIGLVLVMIAGGFWWWQERQKVCCAPPPEEMNRQVNNGNLDTVTTSQNSWLGHWQHYNQDDQGYSQGTYLEFSVQNDKIVADYDAVWSFPNAPAARLNNGTITIPSTNSNSVTGRWEGSRDDAGELSLSLGADGQTMTMVGELDKTENLADFSLVGERTFFRNQWFDWNSSERKVFLQKVTDLLVTKHGGYTTQSAEDATVTVVQDFAIVNAFVPNAPDEESGWVYLKKEAGEWQIILGPAVKFSQTEFDRAGVHMAIRY